MNAMKLIFLLLSGGRLFWLLLLFAGISNPLQAQFAYTVINGTVTITGYNGSGGAVTIPSTINGLPVTAIGSAAFINKFTLTSLSLPETLTDINNSAFRNCTGLTNVTIPKSVTTIRPGAFAQCTRL